MGYNLKGKVVVITGSSRGIGREAALEFAKEGARVVVSARTVDDLNNLVDEIKKRGGEAIAIPADMRKREDIENLINEALQKMGRIDVLVNNAGMGMFAEVKDMKIEDWERLIALNLWGPIYAIHAVLPHLLKNGEGQIINISSIAGKVAIPGTTAYSVTKFGIAALSEGMYGELKRFGIDTILVCPGPTNSEFFDKAAYVGIRQLPVPKIWQSVESVARAIVDASKKRKREVVLGPVSKLAIFTKNYLPRTTAFTGAQAARIFDYIREKE